jgi:hypothetical protein
LRKASASAQLEQLSAGPQPRQRQRRVRPCRHRQAHLRRQVVEQEVHGLVHLGSVGHVVVVEREDGGLGRRLQVVDQAHQHVVDGPVGLQPGEGVGAEVGAGRP